MGRPVVTTTHAAATVGGTADLDLLAAPTAPEVAALIAGLKGRGDLDGIVVAGRDHLEVAFSTAAHDEAVDALLDAMGR